MSGEGSKQLKGKVAVITGASSGIGAAIAVSLTKAGAQVAMGARRVEKLAALQAQIENDGGVAIFKQMDVTIRSEVQELVDLAESTFGPVDILVNNAGVLYKAPMSDLRFEEWDRMIEVNCKGVTNGIGAVIEKMRKRGRGHIVNISSVSGRMAFENSTIYTGTKHFIEGVSQSLRREVCKFGVKVTSIQPGLVETEIIQNIPGYEWPDDVMKAEDIAASVLYAVTQPNNVAVNEILIQNIQPGIIQRRF